MEGNNHLQKRQRIENQTRVAAFVDLDVLDCPVCFEPLTIPISECEDGHLVCRFCLPKARNKCPGPACDLPIGNKRCIPMEKVLGSVMTPCRNAKSGCTNKFSYGEVSIHEKECNFSICSCPKLGCDYTGPCKSIYDHFVCNHFSKGDLLRFSFGDSIDVLMNINDRTLVLRERFSFVRVLFALQCFKETRGVYVTVRGIAQSATELGKFSYRLSYCANGHTVTYESPEVKRLLDVSSESPEESLMFISNSLLCDGKSLKMKLCIQKKE